METLAPTSRELAEISLKQASLVWIEYRDRSTRAGDNDGSLLLKRNQAMDRINYLLENYLIGLDDGTTDC